MQSVIGIPPPKWPILCRVGR